MVDDRFDPDEAERLYDHIFRGQPYKEPPASLWPKIKRRLKQNEAIDAAKKRNQHEQEEDEQC